MEHRDEVITESNGPGRIAHTSLVPIERRSDVMVCDRSPLHPRDMCCTCAASWLVAGIYIFITAYIRHVPVIPCRTVIGPDLRPLKSSNYRTAVAADGTFNVTEMQLNGERTNGAEQTQPGTPAALTGLLAGPEKVIL